ncbi:MAG: hypothetical protein ACP5NS_03860 [Candidatus Pacearchaeota archaeon]
MRINKTVIGLGIATVLALGASALHEIKSRDLEKRTTEDTQRETVNERQRALNEAFDILKPEYISKVVYDPSFVESDKSAKERLEAFNFPPLTIEAYLSNLKRGNLTHQYMHTIPIFRETGDGKKRPVFVRKPFFETIPPPKIEDMVSGIYHEEFHAESNALGYEIDDRRIQSDELIEMLRTKKIRSDKLVIIEEFGAYARQYERIEKTSTGPSIGFSESILYKAFDLYLQMEAERLGKRFTPTEERMAKVKLNRHRRTIETLKKMK